MPLIKLNYFAILKINLKSDEHLNSDAKENSTIFVSSELDIQIE